MSIKTAAEVINRSMYKSQYQDDRWTSLSKRIRDTRGACEFCHTTEGLQTHHTYYDFSKPLWEYDESELIVICESCHKEVHKELHAFRKIVSRYVNPKDLHHINACLFSGITHYGAQTYIRALVEFTKNERIVMNHARYAA